MIQKQMNSIKK